jgi:uncharacterized protein YneF (UPF0154 family)
VVVLKTKHSANFYLIILIVAVAILLGIIIGISFKSSSGVNVKHPVITHTKDKTLTPLHY